MNILAWGYGHIKKLFEIQDSAHAIALGVAIGIFWGFTPLWGMKTMLTLVCAIGFRANKIAAVLAVNLHDLLFPIFPFLFDLEYHLGEHFLRALGVPVDPFRFEGMHHLKHMMNWTTFVNVGEPILIGSFLFALLTSPLIYLGARSLVAASQRAVRKAGQST